MRTTWTSYFEDVDGLIFVVDSSDFASLEVARSEFEKTIQLPELTGAPFLVLANKQDVRGSRTAAQITECLNLCSIRNRSWHIQPSCACSGVGLTEGLDWLASRIKERQSLSNAMKSIFNLGA